MEIEPEQLKNGAKRNGWLLFITMISSFLPLATAIVIMCLCNNPEAEREMIIKLILP